MKLTTKEILHQAGIGDWVNTLKDKAGDLMSGKPSINREQVPVLDKFKQQTELIIGHLTKAIEEAKKLGIEGIDYKEVENSLKWLEHFYAAININNYEIVHTKPEDVK